MSSIIPAETAHSRHTGPVVYHFSKSDQLRTSRRLTFFIVLGLANAIAQTVLANAITRSLRDMQIREKRNTITPTMLTVLRARLMPSIHKRVPQGRR